MEKLNDEDFRGIIVSAALSKNPEEKSSYVFEKVNDIEKKLIASVNGNKDVLYFVVATKQDNIENLSSKVIRKKNLGELVKFVKIFNKETQPFLIDAIKSFSPQNRQTTELLLKEYKTRPSMNEPEWKKLLHSLNSDEKLGRSVYEYVLKPSPESEMGLRLFITAPSGGGKTYLLKQIAARCAEEKIYIPFFVSLQEGKKEDTDFLKFLSKQAKKKFGSEVDKLKKWVGILDKYAESGNMLFLFEGLSNLSRSDDLYKSFNDFVKKYTEAPMIVTCVENQALKYFEDFSQFHFAKIDKLVQGEPPGDFTDLGKRVFWAYKRDPEFSKLMERLAFFRSVIDSANEYNYKLGHVSKLSLLENHFNTLLKSNFSPEEISDVNNWLTNLARMELSVLFPKNKSLENDFTVKVPNESVIKILKNSGVLSDEEREYKFTARSFLAYYMLIFLQNLNNKDNKYFKEEEKENQKRSLLDPLVYDETDEKSFLRDLCWNETLRKLLVLMPVTKASEDHGLDTDTSIMYETDLKIIRNLSVISEKDPFLKASTLIIERVCHNPELLKVGKIKEFFKTAKEQVLRFWRNVTYNIQEGPIYEALIVLILHSYDNKDYKQVNEMLDFVTVKRQKGQDPAGKTTDDFFGLFRGRADDVIQNYIVKNYLGLDSQNRITALNSLRLLGVRLNSEAQIEINNLLNKVVNDAISGYELELLSLLAVNRCDDNVSSDIKDSLVILFERYINEKKKTSSTLQKLSLIGAALWNQGVFLEKLTKIIDDLLIKIDDSVSKRDYEGTDIARWELIDFVQHSDLILLRTDLKNRILRELDTLIQKREYHNKAKNVVSKLITNTSNFDLRRQLAKIISDPLDSEGYTLSKLLENPHLLHSDKKLIKDSNDLSNIHRLCDEIITREDGAIKTVTEIIQHVLYAYQEPEKVIEIIRNLFIYGTDRTKERVVKIFEDAHPRRVGDKNVEDLRNKLTQALEDNDLRTSKLLLGLYIPFFIISKDPNIELVLKKITPVLGKNRNFLFKEDEYFVSSVENLVLIALDEVKEVSEDHLRIISDLLSLNNKVYQSVFLKELEKRCRKQNKTPKGMNKIRKLIEMCEGANTINN